MWNRLSALALVGALAAGLIGCSAEPEAGSQAVTAAGAMDMAPGSHAAAPGAQLLAEERFAAALATVVGVNPESAEITLDHEPLDAIDMGAMTMAFNVAGDVDLGRISQGDRVAVRIRQRTNYTYELVDVCRAEDESMDCLR